MWCVVGVDMDEVSGYFGQRFDIAIIGTSGNEPNLQQQNPPCITLQLLDEK